jgi:3-hydroxyacyl-[acyl-carrier-protein] dehydratase
VPLQASIFEGHFPGFPLMPGVLLTEAMAQTAGWMLLAFNKFHQMPFLAGIREAKFRNFVKPGDTLDIHAKAIHEGSGFAVAQARAELNGKIVCDATIMYRVVDFPNEEIKRSMIEMAANVGVSVKVGADD